MKQPGRFWSREKLKWRLMAVFLCSTLLWLTAFNHTKPRLLIVHSLSKTSTWSSAVDEGIERALQRNRLPVAVSRIYLNLDILSDQANQDRFVQEVHRKIAGIDPHVLVAVDDETNHLIARHYVGQRRPQLVYTGLMHEPERYGYDKDQGIIGIREPVPLGPITSLLDAIAGGKTLKLAVLGVDDLTGAAEMRQVLDHPWGQHQRVAQALVSDFGALKAFVEGPARQADVLLVLSIDKVPAGPDGLGMVSELQATAWTERHSIPLPIGVRDSFVRLGGGLAVSVPPTELGDLAMQMAFAKLPGARRPLPMTTVTATDFDISVRPAVLAKREVPLPDIYVQAARAAGRLYP